MRKSMLAVALTLGLLVGVGSVEAAQSVSAEQIKSGLMAPGAGNLVVASSGFESQAVVDDGSQVDKKKKKKKKRKHKRVGKSAGASDTGAGAGSAGQWDSGVAQQ